MSKPKPRMRRPARRVLIVDAHPALREALASRIAEEKGLEVCGEATTEAEALRLAASTQPDVLVTGLIFPSGGGIDLLKRLKSRYEKLRMIVWSSHSEEHYAERALRAGARGYVSKEEPTGKVIEAIRQVVAGSVYLSSAMTDKLVKRSVSPPGKASEGSPIDVLSDRELDIFELIGKGVKTVEIATRLHLSPKTVETYRGRIRQKLFIRDGTELARIAVRWVMEHE